MMANQEHLEILKRGADVWNAWRRANIISDKDLIKPDLNKANLSSAILIGCDLRGANLNNANLLHANLAAADLKAAKMRGANLRHASLIEADLRIANLEGANLREAQMSESRLSGANLRQADLTRASLHKADLANSRLGGSCFYKASVGETIFSNVDLSHVSHLDSCLHTGPCIIDHRTLAASKGVPLSFWRGCGLTHWQIEAAKLSQPSLTQEDVTNIGYEVIRLRTNQPIQLFSAFISYSSKDEEFARQLYDELQDKGVRCWFAPENMKIGDRIRPRIDEVIHVHDKLLLVLSEHSVASQWVEQEVETALSKERESREAVLFPIKVDCAVDNLKTGWPALIRNTRHIGDFTNWQNGRAFEASVDRVLRDLRAKP